MVRPDNSIERLVVAEQGRGRRRYESLGRLRPVKLVGAAGCAAHRSDELDRTIAGSTLDQAKTRIDAGDAVHRRVLQRTRSAEGDRGKSTHRASVVARLEAEVG